MLASPAEPVAGPAGGWPREYRGDQAVSSPPYPTAGTAHLWWWCSPPEPDPRDLELLQPAELEQVDRYRRAVDAASFAARRARVRRILAAYLGSDPARVRTGRDPCPRCGSDAHGPPALQWPPAPLRISVSASRGRGLLAVANGHPVGVDLQADTAVQVDGVQRMACTPDERRLLAETPPGQQLPLFLRAWARKEAVVKAMGVGLVVELTTVEVRPGEPGPVSVRVQVPPPGQALAGEWLVSDVELGDGWYAAVAVPAGV